MQRRATCDHPQIREARQTSHDVFRKSVRQRGEVGIIADVLERQDGDPEAFVAAGSARVANLHCDCGCRFAADLQPRLAESFNQALAILGIEPFLDLPLDRRADVRPQPEQISHGLAGFLTLTELPVGGRDQGVPAPIVRHIAFECEGDCTAIVAFAVSMVEVCMPVPPGVIGIELLGTFCERQTAMRVPSIGQKLTE